MSSRFKTGDPVWARSRGMYYPAGEYPAVLLRIDYWVGPQAVWIMDVFTMPGMEYTCGESQLRPRRDDYQQHEPLGRMTDTDKPLADQPTEAPLHV